MRSGYRRGVPDEGSWIVGFAGSAGRGSVRVELSETGAAVGVHLLPGWRATVAERLGPAVLHAFTAAMSARLQAQAAAAPKFDFTAGTALRALGTGPDTAALLADAARDLHEFVGQLAALHDTPRAVAGAGGRITATVRRGQVVAVAVDDAWRERAGHAELAHGLGEALRACLRLIADTPLDAMAGCPALTAVLRLTREPVATGALR
jgi:hypothetical protein